VLTVARRRLTGGLPSIVSGTILLTGACKPLAYGTRLWPDDVKGDLNQASVSLGLVLLVFVVFINCCLDFFRVVIWL